MDKTNFFAFFLMSHKLHPCSQISVPLSVEKLHFERCWLGCF